MIFNKMNHRTIVLTFISTFFFLLSIFASLIFNAHNVPTTYSMHIFLHMLILLKSPSLVAIIFFISSSIDINNLSLSKWFHFYFEILGYTIPLTIFSFAVYVGTINRIHITQSIFPFIISNYWPVTIFLLAIILFILGKNFLSSMSIHLSNILLSIDFTCLLVLSLLIAKHNFILVILWSTFALLLGFYLNRKGKVLSNSSLPFSFLISLQIIFPLLTIIILLFLLKNTEIAFLHVLLPITLLASLVVNSHLIFSNQEKNIRLSNLASKFSIGMLLIFGNPLILNILTLYFKTQNAEVISHLLRHLILFSFFVTFFAVSYTLIFSWGIIQHFSNQPSNLFTLPISIFLISICYLIYDYSQFYGQGLSAMVAKQNGRLYVELLNLLLIALLYLIIQTIFNRFWYTNTLFLMLMLILSYANYAKLIARSEPIIGSDFGLIKSLPDIVKMVNLKIVAALIVGLVVLIGASIFLQHFYLKGPVYKFPLRIFIFVGSCLILFGFAQTENQLNLIAWKQQKPTDKNIFFTALNHSGFQAHPESLEAAANEYGPATTFMGTLIIKTMDKPSGYSSQRITKIEQKYQGIAKKINKTRKNKSLNSQTVVYVLSESYADPRMLPTVKLTSNPIPYEQEIERTNTSGLMYSPGYGGGTANIEFEALTGLSMNNFDPSMVTPYVFLVPKVNNLPVITDYFKIKNAIHPYTGTTYNRTEVFKKFGFQHFYNFKGDKLTYTKKIGKSQYISDDSAYRQLLKQLNSTSKGQFVQLSTMQNHMPYIPGTYAKNTYKATGKLTKSSLSKVESYSQGLNYTDKALKMLISHVSKMKKHVTIVWYGDHLPGLYYGSLVSGKNATKYDNRLHQTNYFIYSNYHHQSLSHTKIVSPNMFTPMVFAQTNTKVSPYMALLTEINRYVPAAERDKFMNEKGNYISENKLSKKAKQILADYKLIQYDITAGKQYSIKHKNFVK